MKVIPNNIYRIEQYIDELRQRHPDISNLFRNLEVNSSFYFIGGLIRSLYNEKPIRDIDIIYNSYNGSIPLSSVLSKANRNSLNGYRIEADGLTFDLWSIFDNWAFKNKHYPPSFENIQLGTFYNFDSLVYGYKEKKLCCSIYNKAVRTNTLDIINKTEVYITDNPTYDLNIVKACIYKYKHKLNFSTEVNRYIHKWRNECGDINKLIREELRHFKKRQINDDAYYEILNQYKI